MRERRWAGVRHELRHHKGSLLAVIWLGFIVALSIFAFVLPYDPNATDIGHMLEGPSAAHWFGTDDLGRDYLTRAIYGGRVSLLVGVAAMACALVIGIVVGTTSGYFGGIVDTLLMRLIDVISSIPFIILVTVASVLMRPGLRTIILVIGLFSWMEIARLVRAETLSAREREFVLYADFAGAPSWRIILRHVIPIVFPTIIVAATISIANAIMTESALSFLGLGIQQPMSSWGSMLQTAQSRMSSAPHMAVLPGLLIMFTVFSFNKVGDLMRIYVDPKTTAGER